MHYLVHPVWCSNANCAAGSSATRFNCVWAVGLLCGCGVQLRSSGLVRAAISSRCAWSLVGPGPPLPLRCCADSPAASDVPECLQHQGAVFLQSLSIQSLSIQSERVPSSYMLLPVGGWNACSMHLVLAGLPCPDIAGPLFASCTCRIATASRCWPMRQASTQSVQPSCWTQSSMPALPTGLRL